MKKILLPVFAALLALTSCKDDFKVSAPYKDITVVYGILDRTDTAHYIRIEKAFLDETKSALTMAQVPDSSFYANLDVVLQEIGTTTTAIPLTKVDLNTEGYIKQPAGSQGFFTSPSYAYKFKHTLDPALQYRLLITNKNSGRIDSSDILGIVSNDSTIGQDNFYINGHFNNSNYPIDFSKTLPVYTFTVNGNTPKNGYMLEGHLVFHYVDSNINTGAEEFKTADYLYATVQDAAGTSFNLETPNYTIYSFLADAMGPAPAGIARLMDSCDVLIYAGSKELYNYQQINIAQNGGLTGDQIKPNYTNMLGSNALGIIGSKTFRIYRNAYLENATLDSLAANPLTAPLNIKGRTLH